MSAGDYTNFRPTLGTPIETYTVGDLPDVVTIGGSSLHWGTGTNRARNGAFEALAALPWAMRPEQLQAFAATLLRSDQGQLQALLAFGAARVDDGAAQSPGTAKPYVVADGGLAIVDLRGVITKSSAHWGTTTTALKAAVAGALTDPSVSAIVLRGESPGGVATDVAETADFLARAGKKKPIFGVLAGSMACSACYWLMSQSQQLLATRGSEVGSIGTWMLLVDQSKALLDEGIRVIAVRSAPNKARAMLPGDEITEQDVEHHRAQSVAPINDMFRAAVASGRGLDKARLDAVADGSVWFAEDAKRLGLIDEVVRDFDHALARIRAALKQSGASGAGVRSAASAHKVRGKMDENETPAPRAYATAEEFSTAQPKLANELIERGRREGRAEERERSKAIRNYATPAQRELADQLCASDKPLGDAKDELHQDLVKRSETAAALNAKDRQELGTPDGTTEQTSIRSKVAGPRSGESLEMRAAKAWDADPSLKQKFGDIGIYRMHLENEANDAAKGGKGR